MSRILFPVRPEDDGTMGDDGEVRVYVEQKPVKRQERANITGSEKFLARLNEFTAALQKMVNEHFAQNLSNLTPPEIVVMNGSKNVRVVRKEPHTRSVHCFINKETGDIYKAAGWAAPAKHARGNIYNQDMMTGVTVYGAAYL